MNRITFSPRRFPQHMKLLFSFERSNLICQSITYYSFRHEMCPEREMMFTGVMDYLKISQIVPVYNFISIEKVNLFLCMCMCV